jgi:PAS domain S-box-containing protein
MKVIEICGDSNYPPFEYIDNDGECKGFNVDITKSIAKEMGFDISFNLMEWTKAIEYVKSNDFQAIQGMSISSKRRESFSFSKEYITVFHSIYTLKERTDINQFDDLYKLKIAVQENDISFDIITKKANVNKPIHVVVVSNQEIALQLLINKEVDAIAGNRLTILYYAKEKSCTNLIKSVGEPINITKFGIGFRKNRRDLLSLFNLGIHRIKENGVYKSIYDKWFGQQIDYLDNQIIENVGTGVVCLNSLGIITAINNSACSLLELKKENNILKSFYESDLTKVIDGYLIQEILDDSSTAYLKEIKYFTNEEEKWLKVNLSPLLDFENSIIGVIINFRDITKDKKTEEALKTQEKMQSLGRLILNVAHEIRNPLTSIKNFVSLIPENFDDEEFRASLLKHVPQQVGIIDNILKDLLMYSSPKEPNIVSVKLTSFFQELKECIKPNKSIYLKFDIEKQIEIHVDEKQLWQIMMNIINNAIDAVEEEGVILISAVTAGNNVKICIEDDGIGILKEDISKIFDPFFTNKESGTGLGLYITYQLINENNGEIEIESNGRGTKVMITFRE